jgi:hypothetical protein
VVLKDGPVAEALMKLAESLARQVAIRNAQPQTLKTVLNA